MTVTRYDFQDALRFITYMYGSYFLMYSAVGIARVVWF